MTSMPYTNSELSAVQRCERMHGLTYGRRLVPKAEPSPTAATSLGTRYHEFCDRYYSGEDPDDLLRELESDDSSSGKYTFWTFKGYLDWLEVSGADADRETVAAEQAVTKKLGAYSVTGKIDLIQRDLVTGELVLVDHKTTGMPPKRKATELRTSDQGAHYSWLTGITRVEYRVIQRVAGGGSEWDVIPVEVVDMKLSPSRRAAFQAHLRHRVTQAGVNRDGGAGIRYAVDLIPTRAHDCSWICPFAEACIAAEDHPVILEELLAESFAAGDPLARYADVEEF